MPEDVAFRKGAVRQGQDYDRDKPEERFLRGILRVLDRRALRARHPAQIDLRAVQQLVKGVLVTLLGGFDQSLGLAASPSCQLRGGSTVIPFR